MPSIDRVVQAQVSIPYFTNIPGDVITNTTHWIYQQVAAPTATEFGQLANLLDTFHTQVQTAAWAPPNHLNIAGATVTMYDLQQPTPRVPVYTQAIPLTPVNAAAATSVPCEVAVVLSLTADPVPGIPVARQRGRLYVGGVGALSAGSTSSFPNIGATARGVLAQACEDLLVNAQGFDWQWVIYSPTQNAILGQETFDITHGFINNEPDTQRRRGIEATARTLWP